MSYHKYLHKNEFNGSGAGNLARVDIVLKMTFYSNTNQIKIQQRKYAPKGGIEKRCRFCLVPRFNLMSGV